jgi:hypothetical protein
MHNILLDWDGTSANGESRCFHAHCEGVAASNEYAKSQGFSIKAVPLPRQELLDIIRSRTDDLTLKIAEKVGIPALLN